MKRTAFFKHSARHLRKNSTHSETLLWEILRNHRFFGLGFRRQHPMAGYILDFYCPQLRIAIEMDGKRHNTKDVWQADLIRDKVLRQAGIETVRFSDAWIEDALPNIIKTIAAVVQWRAEQLSSNPPL
jgi:very-short-patch-repair endonuclease